MAIDESVTPQSEARDLESRLAQVEALKAESIDRNVVNQRCAALWDKFSAFVNQAREIETTGAGFRVRQFGQRVVALSERAALLVPKQ